MQVDREEHGEELCTVVRVLLALLVASLAPSLATAQGWPNERPIRLIVPFQAGSSSDSIARIVGQRLSERLGQQIVIDNRVGASSMLGTEAVARSAPDGYTIGLANTTTHASATALTASPSYDPVKDFAPVGMIGSSPFVLLGAPKLPAGTVTELIAMAKAKPATINYASAGPATMAHLSGALFEKMAGVKLIHVPYRGTGQSVVDLMESRIELLFGTIAPSVAHVRNGKLRALATTGLKRNGMLADIPTMSESGLAGYESALWSALVLRPARRRPSSSGSIASLSPPSLQRKGVKRSTSRASRSIPAPRRSSPSASASTSSNGVT
jgi:tripartite-type tricarboxylate transporter receptor subunit TctC